MSIDLKLDEADPTRFGWKAHYLSRLNVGGFLTPGGYALQWDEEPTESFLDQLDSAVSYAVRSSGLSEDSSGQSLAGSFASVLGARGKSEIVAAIDNVRASGAGQPIGVVIQPLIDAERSGVAFSLNPTTYATDELTISWIPGLGVELVSGNVKGNDIILRATDFSLLSGQWDVELELLSQLGDAVAALAAELGGPVDVEWCVEASSRRLVILQVRPVVLAPACTLDLRYSATFPSLPSIVRRHPKIRLREHALGFGILMTPAVVSVANSRETPDIPAVSRTALGSSSSVVLVYPTTVEKKVVREFANVGAADVDFFADSCRRYSIRQYPSEDGLVDTQMRVLTKGLEKSAISVIIEQEIWDAHATGIVRRVDDGYLIEAGLGHFIPKGYVQTSSYLLDEKLNVIAKNEVDQFMAYHFLSGHVVTDDTVSLGPQLTVESCRSIVVAMKPMLEADPGLALEFGLTHNGPAGHVYLIDAAESDHEKLSISRQDLERGVISHGTAQGIVHDLREPATSADLNSHLLQEIEGESSGEPTVYVAARASVDLLPLLYACAPGSGFVFEEAGLLAHLSVVLRERGIAGIVLPRETVARLVESAEAKIDTNANQTVQYWTSKISG